MVNDRNSDRTPPNLTKRKIKRMVILCAIYIPSSCSIWRAAGQCVGPTFLSTLYSRLTYCGWQHNRHLCGRHCRPNYTWRSDSNDTQTANTFNQNQFLVEKWRMKANGTKSVQVTFTPKKSTCPHIHLNNKHLTQAEDVKYLGIHLDRKLTWRKHISTKRKHLSLKLRKLYWIIGRTKQSWNLSGPMAYNCEDQHQNLI